MRFLLLISMFFLAGCTSAMIKDRDTWRTPEYTLSAHTGGTLGSGWLNGVGLEIPDQVSAPVTGGNQSLRYGSWFIGLGSFDFDGFRDESDATFGTDLEEALTNGVKFDLGYRRSWASSHFPESYTSRIGNVVYTTYTGKMIEGPSRFSVGGGLALWQGETEYTYTNFSTETDDESIVSLYGEFNFFDFINFRYDTNVGVTMTVGGAFGF